MIKMNKKQEQLKKKIEILKKSKNVEKQLKK